MIIIDTNVVSELMKPPPEQSRQVHSWMSQARSRAVHATAVSVAEIMFGLEILPDGRRRRGLRATAEQVFAVDLEGRILPFDGAAARHYATIRARRRLSGRPMAAFDCQIAAIARANDMALATRNVTDFADCGIDLIDPWEG